MTVFQSSVGPVDGPQVIECMSGSNLVKLFNELAEKGAAERPVKKFSDNKTGRNRTIQAWHKWRVQQPQKATPITPTMPPSVPKAVTPAPKPEPAKAKKSTKAEGAGPREPELLDLKPLGEIKPHKRSTNRGRIITLASLAGGATLAELEGLTGWGEGQIRSCLRQINQHTGHGVQEHPRNVFTVLGIPLDRKPMNWVPTKAEVRKHRQKTKRAKAIELLTRPEGATFEDIKRECSWNDVQAYEGIKLLHAYLGYGIKEEGGVIRAFVKGGG